MSRWLGHLTGMRTRAGTVKRGGCGTVKRGSCGTVTRRNGHRASTVLAWRAGSSWCFFGAERSSGRRLGEKASDGDTGQS